MCDSDESATSVTFSLAVIPFLRHSQIYVAKPLFYYSLQYAGRTLIDSGQCPIILKTPGSIYGNVANGLN